MGTAGSLPPRDSPLLSTGAISTGRPSGLCSRERRVLLLSLLAFEQGTAEHDMRAASSSSGKQREPGAPGPWFPAAPLLLLRIFRYRRGRHNTFYSHEFLEGVCANINLVLPLFFPVGKLRLPWPCSVLPRWSQDSLGEMGRAHKVRVAASYGFL